MRPVVVCKSTVAGGGERYLRELYGGLAERGHDPYLIGDIPDWQGPSTDALGPKWSKRTVARGFTQLPGERRAAGRVLDSVGGDFAHAQYKREQIGLTDTLARNGPVLWTEHGRWLSGPTGKALAVAYRLAARKVSALRSAAYDHRCRSRVWAEEHSLPRWLDAHEAVMRSL